MNALIPAEFTPLEGRVFEELEVTVTATSDPVVTSCDLLNLEIPGVGTLTLVLDAAFRIDSPNLAYPLQAIFNDVYDEAN